MTLKTTGIKEFSPALLLAFPFIIGLIPQSGDHPLMLVPFLLMATILILLNKILKLSLQDPMLLAILGLWLIWGTSGLLSPVPFPSKITWLIFGALPLAYMMGATLKTHFLPLTALTAASLALYAFYDFVVSGHFRPDFPFDDANLLGIFFATGILASLRYKFTWVFIPIILGALILTESRTALLALILGAIPFFFLHKKQPLETLIKNKMVWAVTLTLLVVIIPLTLITHFDDRLLLTMEHSTGRLAIWKASLNMAMIHPLTGLGLGTFHLHYPVFRLAGDDSLGWMVHMEPLQSAVESGWLSTLLLYIIFIMADLQTYAKKQNKNLSKDQIIATSILVVIFVSMHLTYPLHTLPFLMIMGLCLATLYKKTTPYNQSALSLAFSTPLLLTLLGTIWLALSGVYTFMIWNETQTARRLHDQKKFDATLTECLDHGDPTFPDCRLMAARFLSLAQKADTHQMIRLLDEAEHANPINPEIPYLRARSLLITDPNQTGKILPLLEESLRRNPQFWPARKMTINVMLNTGQKTQAQTILEQGLIYPYPKQTRLEIESLRTQINATY